MKNLKVEEYVITLTNGAMIKGIFYPSDMGRYFDCKEVGFGVRVNGKFTMIPFECIKVLKGEGSLKDFNEYMYYTGMYFDIYSTRNVVVHFSDDTSMRLDNVFGESSIGGFHTFFIKEANNVIDISFPEKDIVSIEGSEEVDYDHINKQLSNMVVDCMLKSSYADNIKATLRKKQIGTDLFKNIIYERLNMMGL